jgi:hypothetical protein
MTSKTRLRWEIVSYSIIGIMIDRHYLDCGSEPFGTVLITVIIESQPSDLWSNPDNHRLVLEPRIPLQDVCGPPHQIYGKIRRMFLRNVQTPDRLLVICEWTGAYQPTSLPLASRPAPCPTTSTRISTLSLLFSATCMTKLLHTAVDSCSTTTGVLGGDDGARWAVLYPRACRVHAHA